MMKATTLCAAALLFALAGCDVEQTREARAPDVDVDVQGGQAPAYDVDAPDVDVNAKEKVVTVPDVDVNTEKKTVTVPDVDVKRADAEDPTRDDG